VADLLQAGVLLERDQKYELTSLGWALEEEVIRLFYDKENEKLSEKIYKRS